MKTFGGLIAVSAAVALAACAEEASTETEAEAEAPMVTETAVPADATMEGMDGEAMEGMEAGDAAPEEDVDPTTNPVGPG